MKTALYTGLMMIALVACRQKRVTSSNSSDFSSQTTSATTQTVDGNTTTTTTTTVSSETSTSTENSTDASVGGNDSNVTVVSAGGAEDTSKTYRVTVSFASKGTGVDIVAVEDFENWLNNYPKHPAYDKTQWGREGETSFCLKLKELSTREQEIFVRDVRTKLADKQLVFVDEYAECKGHKVN